MKPATKSICLLAILAWLLAGCGVLSNVPATLTPAVRASLTTIASTPLPAAGLATPSTAPREAAQSTRPPPAVPPGSPTRATPVRATQTPDAFPTIRASQLPPEARQTITLIEKGGPFPYRQDGVVFENREGLLPYKTSGYYHEYTVVTPGSPDRGARRIIAGTGGEMYYTDDHYASFKRIIP